ncbi:TadE/TadG family type IV pilus assembly protein [Methylobacterium sp. CM6257]
MLAGPSGSAPLRRLCGPRAFSCSRSGAAAVEFALVAMPFLALVGATLEAGVTYFAQEILQQAVTDAGRQIYTGQFQAANASVTDTATLLNNFRTAMCYPGGKARITVFPCASVRVSITKAASFGSATPVQATATNPKTGVSDWNAGFGSYACARASDVMVVQAAVDLPVYFPLLGAAYATLPNRRRVIQAATVFQVEPFNSTAVCPSGS